MCIYYKVANLKGTGKNSNELEEWLNEALVFSSTQQPIRRRDSEMASADTTSFCIGLDREKEMSAMVSALTHVVSGEFPAGDLVAEQSDISGSHSSGGDSSVAKNKRGRELEEGGSSNTMSLENIVQKVSRPFDENSHPGPSSVLRGELNFPLFSIHPNISFLFYI